MSAIVLECVPRALEATYVQEALQSFAWSMGMEVREDPALGSMLAMLENTMVVCDDLQDYQIYLRQSHNRS